VLMIKKYVEDAMYPFSMADKQLLLTIFNRCEEYGATIAEAIDLVKAEIQAARESINPVVGEAAKRSNKHVILCPDCKFPVTISNVNTCKGTAVGGDWKTSLMCTNDLCRFTELSKKTMKEWRNGNNNA